jgi:hypothetical protein
MSKTFKDVKKYYNGKESINNRKQQRTLKQMSQYAGIGIERE